MLTQNVHEHWSHVQSPDTGLRLRANDLAVPKTVFDFDGSVLHVARRRYRSNQFLNPAPISRLRIADNPRMT